MSRAYRSRASPHERTAPFSRPTGSPGVSPGEPTSADDQSGTGTGNLLPNDATGSSEAKVLAFSSNPGSSSSPSRGHRLCAGSVSAKILYGVVDLGISRPS